MYDNCFCFIQGTKRDNVDKEDGNKSKKSKRLVFTRRMREELKNGDWLNDEHMSFAHQLIEQQFPDFSGMQLTLLSETYGFSPISRTQKCIQIHFVNNNHWVTSSFMGGDTDVSLYDSQYSG